MIIDRIQQIIDSQGITVRQFEKNIGSSEGTIRNAIKKNAEINSKWLKKIADLYPHLNLDWLITGNGEMYKSEIQKAHESTPGLISDLAYLKDQNQEILDLLNSTFIKDFIKEKRKELSKPVENGNGKDL